MNFTTGVPRIITDEATSRAGGTRRGDKGCLAGNFATRGGKKTGLTVGQR